MSHYVPPPPGFGGHGVLRAALCCGVLSSFATRGAESPEPPVFTREQAVQRALEKSLELQQLSAEIDAAGARLDGASLLLQDNPEASAEVGPRTPPSGTKVEYGLQLTQTLEIAGQRGARMGAAENAVRAARQRFDARRAELAATVRDSYGRTALAAEQLRLAREAEELSRQVFAAATERQRRGAASRLEVNTARVELARAIRERTVAEVRSLQEEATFRLLLLLPPEVPAPRLELRADVPPRPDTSLLLQQALDNRQDLAAARSDIARSDYERSVANREAVPNVNLGVGYRREEGANIVQGLIRVPLPVFNRNQAAKGVAAANARQAEAAARGLEARIRQDVATAAARYDAAVAGSAAFGPDVTAALSETLALGVEAYRAGKLDFLQFALLRRETLEGRRGYLDALSELNAAEAELNRALGVVR